VLLPPEVIRLKWRIINELVEILHLSRLNKVAADEELLRMTVQVSNEIEDMEELKELHGLLTERRFEELKIFLVARTLGKHK